MNIILYCNVKLQINSKFLNKTILNLVVLDKYIYCIYIDSKKLSILLIVKITEKFDHKYF